MNISIPKLEYVATEFDLWRKIKINRFSRIPPHLINLVHQVLPHYKKAQIIKALKLDKITFKRILNKVIHGSHHTSSNKEINFIELSSDAPIVAEPTAYLPSCTLQRPDGYQLKINNSSAQQFKDIVRLFLCCK